MHFGQADGGFPLIDVGVGATVIVDSSDWPGVQRAAADLQKDIRTVAGSPSTDAHKVFAGTLGKSPTIDGLVKNGHLDVRAIQGKWEASVTQVVDIPDIGPSLVIAGSDKRGTIYGLYDVSEAIGVSPWYWWADVPIPHHADVWVTGRTVAKPPLVKYRGIFLNDEAPCLTNWVNANYGGYNHEFYVKVFELLLRLRANYLWPAMWNNCFSEDDPLNPKLADEYGIVMGTSHVEPMMRADKEWNRLGFSEKQWNYDLNPEGLEKFWRDGVTRNKPYENVVTIAMRGKVDTPMSESANIALLEKIVDVQRKILAETVNPDVTQVPQLWCLYKEVQEYYEKGMRVPDDVTLLWADDNWGNIRRLPTPEERKRSGGAGVYYHFDYVGGPRNYKWIDTSTLPKIWEQMSLAYHYGADRIWIVNVGDLKPMEFVTEFFLTLALDPPATKPAQYAEKWAAREFGQPHAKPIAHLITETGRLNARRKPELLGPETYSLVNYNEAERVLGEYHALETEANRLAAEMPPEAQSAFYQFAVHPVKCARVVNEMYVSAAKNALYATQGRASANDHADAVRARFAEDTAVTHEYHSINNAKWNHFMDQTHIGYTYWQQPETNSMPKVKTIEIPEAGALGIGFGLGTSALEGRTEHPDLTTLPNDPAEQDVLAPAERPEHRNVTTPPKDPAEQDVLAPEGRPEHSRGYNPRTQTAPFGSPEWGETTDLSFAHAQPDGLAFTRYGTTHQTVELFNKGKSPVNFTASASEPWIELSATQGTLDKETPLKISIDWAKAPAGKGSAAIQISSAGETHAIPITTDSHPGPVHGFVEGDGMIAIEAEHASHHTPANGVKWEIIPGYGRTLSAVAPFPFEFKPFDSGAGPRLEYEFTSFSEGPVTLEAVVAPSLAFQPGHGLRVAFAIDDASPQTVDVAANYLSPAWEQAVRDSARHIKTQHTVAQPGRHQLKVWAIDPGVVIERLVLDFGGLKPSYLGPPESFRAV